MKVLFLDESGDHNIAIIDRQYPVFVLGGIIVDKNYAEGPLTQALVEFKQELFGRTDLVLHTADITRNRNGFERLKDPEFRTLFYARLNEIMRKLEYSVVACAIRKENHADRYGLAALDPYLFSLNVLVERFCFDIGHVKDGGIIVAEKRDATLNNELELAWLNLKISGTQYLRPASLQNRIAALNLRAKNENIAGLQLADLVVSPIGRHVLGKQDKEDWNIVASKLRRNSKGQADGYGLVVLPK